MRTGIHSANFESSARLKDCLKALYHAGAEGLTSWELQTEANLVAPGTTVSELRSQGWNISCEYDGMTVSGRRTYRYRLIGRKDALSE